MAFWGMGQRTIRTEELLLVAGQEHRISDHNSAPSKVVIERALYVIFRGQGAGQALTLTLLFCLDQWYVLRAFRCSHLGFIQDEARFVSIFILSCA